MTDAHLEELLVRLVDTLFDATWLNTDFHQRDRRPNRTSKSEFGVSHVRFTFAHVCATSGLRFGDFFNTPAQNSTIPRVMGFGGFFKCSFSCHLHDFWSVDRPLPIHSADNRFIQSYSALARSRTSVCQGRTYRASHSGRRGRSWRVGKLSDDKRDLD